MLFDEIYGSYFNTVAQILAEAVKGSLTEKNMYDIIRRKAFGESMISIPDALTGGEWQLLTDDMRTPIEHEPKMPLTTLQKRWLKALLNDPRIRLFDIGDGSLSKGLEDVRPLYEQGTVIYFDQYSDGDPYDDEKYAENFRTILDALKTHRKLKIKFLSGKGKFHQWECVPLRIDYSLKDDKFRLYVSSAKRTNTINIGRILKCSLLEGFEPADAETAEAAKEHVILRLHDERNALERAMLHFSHLEKETSRLDDGSYQIKLAYDMDDETEILIRVLSFGPMLEVTGPERFRKQIRRRLKMQKELMQA